ncbi:hypothetical protein AQPE_2238 [Aquipluma nitroreducens]|uniref:Uncharacterized protein n=1 Tax=Aquipluma nitroreducens TaxID=2010828 RepID=A0A5K7S933_9BACT|nr:hypothetical protein AQPE_2238 [Aquipluma nitroreducens]
MPVIAARILFIVKFFKSNLSKKALPKIQKRSKSNCNIWKLIAAQVKMKKLNSKE